MRQESDLVVDTQVLNSVRPFPDFVKVGGIVHTKERWGKGQGGVGREEFREVTESGSLLDVKW